MHAYELLVAAGGERVRIYLLDGRKSRVRKWSRRAKKGVKGSGFLQTSNNSTPGQSVEQSEQNSERGCLGISCLRLADANA